MNTNLMTRCVLLAGWLLLSLSAQAAPSISLTNPPDGQSVAVGSSVELTVDVTPASGTKIKKVVYAKGTTTIATVTSAPYSYTWKNIAAGTYSLTATATDDKGGVTTSATHSLSAKINQPPTVSLSAPTAGQTFTLPEEIPLSAEAADPDGTISKVEFYQGSTLIGTATSAPYAVTWNDAATGTYKLTAKATDNQGGVTTSAARSITVKTAPPTISLTSPPDGQSVAVGSSVELTVDVTPASGTKIKKVVYARGTTTIATVTTAPYSYTWKKIASGTYSLTATATDDKGGKTTSAAHSLSAQSNLPPTVSLTAPPNNQGYDAPASITLMADASDSDGSIAKVDFYRGNTLIGTVTSAPYAMTWNDVPLGTYSLTAKATDDKGGVSTSAARTVSVVGAAQAREIYYIHSDHLNTPRLITNKDKQPVWRNAPLGEPFGAGTPEEDPENTGTRFEFNLRFPGQYYDKETNTHYNDQRDYNPATGRYIQADPIGIEGGINLYAYVGGNPLSFVDPDGLRGERGASGGSGGQNSNYPGKKCREFNPPQPNSVECQHHQTGKWSKHPRPSDMPFPGSQKSEMCGDICKMGILITGVCVVCILQPELCPVAGAAAAAAQ